MKIVYGLDTKSIEDINQAAVVDVPIEYTDNQMDLEEYLDEHIDADAVILITDLLREREFAKWHFKDRMDDTPCPACGATWEQQSSDKKSLVLTHRDNCAFVKWWSDVSDNG